MYKISNKQSIGRKITASVVLVAFLVTGGGFPVRYSYAQEFLQLPQPGIRISLSPAFTPPLLKGVKVYPDNPFRLDFILDKGNSASSTNELKSESTRLIKYFLASITVPEKDLWVNLSPYEKDRIIPNAFGVTEMGRDLLAQDYILKQITASVIYPEEKIGKEFWDKVYAEARKRYGSTDVPIDTFNKVWIVPAKALVYESKDSAYVVESRLKVLLEEDYLALEKGTVGQSVGEKSRETNKLGSEIVREVVIPILEKEVNEGKNFAQLRQVYQSLILAIWFKDKIRESLFGKAYVDQKKTGGVDVEDKEAKDKIWAQYVIAFKKGAYNYIKEDYDSAKDEVVARKYFSGGAGLNRIREVYGRTQDRSQLPEGVSDSAMIVESNFTPADMSEATKGNVRLSTGTGDQGETGLFRGGRINKSAPEIHLVGLLDELNVLIGKVKVAGVVPVKDAIALQKDVQLVSTYIVSLREKNHEPITQEMYDRIDILASLRKDKDFDALTREIAYFFLQMNNAPENLRQYISRLCGENMLGQNARLRVLGLDALVAQAEALVPLHTDMKQVVVLLDKVAHGSEITEKELSDFESRITDLQKSVKLGREFILPGGNEASYRFDLMRVKVREYERKMTQPVGYNRTFINRLSDYLFYLFAEERAKGEVSTRALEQAKSIFSMASKPYRDKPENLYDLPAHSKFNVTDRSVSLVDEVRSSVKQALTGQSLLDEKNVFIGIPGTFGWYPLRDGKIDWDAVGDIDVSIHVPSDSPETRTFFEAVTKNIETSFASRGLPAPHVLLVATDNWINLSSETVLPYHPDNVYFGVNEQFDSVTRGIRSQALHDVLLQWYLELFDSMEEISTNDPLKAAKRLVQLAMLRGDQKDLQELTLLAEKIISGQVKAGRSLLNEYIEDARPQFSKGEISLILQSDKAMSAVSERVIFGASSVLSQQDANVIFEQMNGQWLFRRGPIDLEIDKDFCNKLGETLTKSGRMTLLFSLRKQSAVDIQDALTSILNSTLDPVEALNAKGIKATYTPKRVLLVAPFGDMEGRQLKYKVPHKGVEILAHRLLRETDDTDALVYNPNLSSEQALYDFVKDHKFDIVGISVVQAVLKKNLEILGRLKLLMPDSIFVAGGNELKNFPLEDVFSSWPIDLLFLDGGTSFVEFARNISPNRTRIENVAAGSRVENVAFNTGEGVKTSKVGREPVSIPTDLDADIPYDQPDLVHHGYYDKVDSNSPQPIAFDRIGRNPYRVYLGNYCRGRCIFCGTTLRTQRDLPPDQVISLIKGRPGETDSLHFESADFLFDRKSAEAISGALAADEQIRQIPKMAIARVDELGDGEILKRMRQAGFQIIAFGIESFDDRVLQGIGKDTTGQKNFDALREAIRVGIKPGMNLILFTPWDTVASTLNTINQSLFFMEYGAYINVVPYLFVGYGRKISKMEDIIGYETYDFPGMKAPFRFPRLNRILDGELSGMRDAVYDRVHQLEESNDYPEWAKRSVSVYSLLIFKAFVQILHERSSAREGVDFDSYLHRIDEAIKRVLKSEESTLKGVTETSAVGVTETWFDAYNQTLQKAYLVTEDGRTLLLRQNDGALNLDEQGVPITAVYDIFVVANGQENYKGYVHFENGTRSAEERGRYEIFIRNGAGGDAFIHRAVSGFADKVSTDPELLLDRQADYRKTGPGFVGHFHRVSSEPLFGEDAPRALFETDAQTLLHQAEAVEAQGYNVLAGTLKQLASLSGERKPVARHKERLDDIGPTLPVSQMDLTRFPDDNNAPVVMAQLGETALRYKPAAISVYERHLKFLPVRSLKEAGVHIGVVSAFPSGLGHADIDMELVSLEEAVKAGADEVDVVMDFEAVKAGRIADAEASLSRFALGVERLRSKYKNPLKIKTILEVSALGDETTIRSACRIALKYSDTLKMVSGFPVPSDGGRKGKGTLTAARIMLEEILFYFQKTAILRGLKITGGIKDWDDPTSPDTSVARYYSLVREVLGNYLGSYFLLEQDLFRIGGYDSLKSFLAAASQDVTQRTRLVAPVGDVYDKYLSFLSDGLSFEPGGYLASKLPEVMVREVSSGNASVEIHRGPTSLSEMYVGGLEAQGIKVERIPRPASAPPYHQFYRIEQDGKVRYLITGVLGSSRELFLVQALNGYYHVPLKNIAIRDFGINDLRPWFNHVLGSYAGKINRVVLMHQIDDYVAMLRKEGLGDAVERLRGDYVDAVVIRTKSGEKVLLFEMQFTNGLQAGPAVDYLVTPVSAGGFGAKDITLHGASGGLGQEIHINDLILYSNVYWDGKKEANAMPNDVNSEKLAALLPSDVQAHWLPIHDIATVLNGSLDMMREVARSGGGAVELELAHAVREASKHKDVKFRAFYEVHDKPALRMGGSEDSLQTEVPGHRDPLKRYRTWVALAKYLFAEKSNNQQSDLVQIEQRLNVPSTVFPEEIGRHGNESVNRVFSTGKHNIVFLGTGEGLAYFAQLKSAWNEAGRKLVYWDAREYLLMAKKFPHFLDMLPFGEMGVPNHTIFIDHIDDILRDATLRKQFSEALQWEHDLRIIGYMDSRSQPIVEKALTQERDTLAQLNFELTHEFVGAMHDKKVVVLGATGLVGRAVMAELNRRGFKDVRGVSKSGSEERGVKAVDLSNPKVLQSEVSGADIVINAAVDLNFSGMEAGGETRAKAREVNVGIPQAVASGDFKGKFVQLSTFYVFGHNEGAVSPDDMKEPISEYGREKLEAEKVVFPMPNNMIVRLGPLIGIDDRGKQKRFYKEVVDSLDAQRMGRTVEPIKASTYPVSSVLSVQQTAEAVVSLIEHDYRGVAQVSGKEPMNAVDQVNKIAEVYNSMNGTKIKPIIAIEQKTRSGSLTPDVQMTTVISPEPEDTFRDIIREAGAGDSAIMLTKGGIDFTRDKMDLQVQGVGQGVQFNFDPAMILQLQNASGLTPVIIGIHPMTTSVPMFLGLHDGADKLAAVH